MEDYRPAFDAKGQEMIDMLAPPPPIQITRRVSFPTSIANRTRIIEGFQNVIGNAITFNG